MKYIVTLLPSDVTIKKVYLISVELLLLFKKEVQYNNSELFLLVNLSQK